MITSTAAFLPAEQGADAFCRLKVYSENENKRQSAYDVTGDFLFFPRLEDGERNISCPIIAKLLTTTCEIKMTKGKKLFYRLNRNH